MRISQINLFNINGCNCPPKRREANFFNSNAVDTVSFKGKAPSKKVEISDDTYRYGADVLMPASPLTKHSEHTRNIFSEVSAKAEHYINKANEFGIEGAKIRKNLEYEYKKYPSLYKKTEKAGQNDTFYAIRIDSSPIKTVKTALRFDKNQLRGIKIDVYNNLGGNSNLISSKLFEYDDVFKNRVKKVTMTDVYDITGDATRLSMNLSEDKIKAVTTCGKCGEKSENAVLEYDICGFLEKVQVKEKDSIKGTERNLSKETFPVNRILITEDFGENSEAFCETFKCK